MQSLNLPKRFHVILWQGWGESMGTFLHGVLRWKFQSKGLNECYGMKIPYRTKVRRTKFSTDKIFRRTKFSTPSRNFDSFVRFLPDFCIEILDKIFDGQNVSSDKIFDTKLKFRHFCPTNFCPIRYLKGFFKTSSKSQIINLLVKSRSNTPPHLPVNH